MNVEFWFDPICPWCWVTSRWMVDVAAQRDIDVTWHAISLAQKNDPPVDSAWFAPLDRTKKLLRVIEAVKADHGAAAVGALYTRFGTLIHHDNQLDFDVAAELEHLGYDSSYAEAYDDESIDAVLLGQMHDGLSLVGDDVGTPIIAFPTADGGRVGLFGPVISKMPTGDGALKLWDGLVAMAETEGFWELKRTRTEDPDMSSIRL